MLTKRWPNPRGLESNTPYYNFFARLDRDDCEILRMAQEKARQEMGGTPSNGLLLMNVLKAYLGEGAPQ